MADLRSQLFRVMDVETTGLDPKVDAIVEIGWSIMRGDGAIQSSGSALVNPDRPIPEDASKIHGIYDADVAGAEVLESVVSNAPDLRSPQLPAVFHNASFDSAFVSRSRQLAEASSTTLCTMRLAQNLIPDAGSYRLESLCHQIGLNLDTESTRFHRVDGDVAATCLLLKHLIDRYLDGGRGDDIEGFFALSAIQRMPFGKHKGQLLSEVPADYIEWLLGRELDDDLRAALVHAKGDQVAGARHRTPSAPPVAAPKPRRWWWPFS